METAIFKMIEKLDFYHGAAIIRVIEDARCKSIAKNECGYVVNGDLLVLLKYTTKAHSPWGFTISTEDISRFDAASAAFNRCILALVCGGDGICALPWAMVRDLIGDTTAWLSTKRAFNGCYSLAGPLGTLRRKIPLNQWPGIVFEKERT